MAKVQLMTKRLVIVTLVAVALVLAGIYVRRQIAIDRCLDSGGRWDYATNVCEH